MCRLLPQNSPNEFSKSGLELVLEASQDYGKMSLAHLKEKLGGAVMETRKALVTPQRVSPETGDTILKELNSNLLTDITEQIRGVLK